MTANSWLTNLLIDGHGVAFTPSTRYIINSYSRK